MGKIIAESKTVEEPLVKYAQKAGWEYVPPKTALHLRKGESGKLFYSVLKDSLIKLNSDFLNEHNVSALVQKIDDTDDTIEGNKQTLKWVRGQELFFDTQEKRNRNVHLIDFLNLENNVFHVTQQWSYENLYKKNRPDVLFLINGMPFAIVENKKPGIKNSMEQAIAQLKRLQQEIPEMMSFPQVFNITDALEYFYGVTWNYTRKNIFNWKKEARTQEGSNVVFHGTAKLSSASGKVLDSRLRENDSEHKKNEVGKNDVSSGNDKQIESERRTKHISLEEAVLTFFEKRRFLKMIKDWILFYYKENELEKTILKQHQTRAIEKIINRCNEQHKNRALIWHTQGSGKTFTMLTTAKLILESNPQATVMVIVDRNELEGQLAIWVKRLIEEVEIGGISVEQADSKKILEKLLKNDFRGLIVSMLHKFKDIPANICNRSDFYVFIDEAHRSVEGDLGNYLTGTLPQATFVGFTGTPIDKTSKGRGTFKVFGKDDTPKGYLDKYSISESIEDGTTVRLKYSLAPNKMRVEEQLLDKEFFQIADTEGISDIETLNKVLSRSAKLRTFLKSSNRIDTVAKYVANHFKQNVQPLGYKAFLVAVDRSACALYKQALDRYLSSKMSQVVYTKGHNDSELLQQYYLSKEEEATIRKQFKKPDVEPQILIVTDKLLTGYDAPILYFMYMDKPMRDHVLLQAVSRVNRPYEDKRGRIKPCGLIVDFVGVFKSMKKALSFDSDEVNAVIEDLDQLLQQFKNMMENNMKAYLFFKRRDSRPTPARGQALCGSDLQNGNNQPAESADKFLEKLIYETLLDTKEREKFIEKFKELESLYEILSPDPRLRPYMDDYKNIAEIYKVVRKLYEEKTDFISDVCRKTEKLIQESAELITFPGITKTYEINTDTLRKIKESQSLDNKEIISLIRSIQTEADKKSKQEPYLIFLSERSQKIMQDFERKQKRAKEVIEAVSNLMDEKILMQKEREQSKLSHQEFTIAWALYRSSLKVRPLSPDKKDGSLEAVPFSQPAVEAENSNKFNIKPNPRGLKGEYGVKDFEHLAIQISESFDKFKNFYSNSDEKRQLKMDMYQILSEHIPDERLVVVSEEIIRLIEEMKK